MIINYEKEMKDVLNKITKNVNKIAIKKGVRIAHTEVYSQTKNTCSLMIETNCTEYILDLIKELLSKEKFEIDNETIGKGYYDWASEIYFKPYVVVTIKAF